MVKATTGPLVLLVLSLTAQYLLSDLPRWLWDLILSNDVTRSALFCSVITSVETLIAGVVFYLIDRIASNRRLTKSKVDTTTYMEAWKFAITNICSLTVFLISITYIFTGDIHGGFGIHGIDVSRFPKTAPSFNKFVLEIITIMLCADFCLYWAHRAHHWRPLYKIIHSVHHSIHDPIAAHATSVHVLELFSVAPIIFLLPRLVYEIFGLHPLSVYFAPHLMAMHGILEHCGYDDFLEYLTFGVVTGSKMHFVHHQVSRANYGFYTYFWDWVFGTKLSYEDMIKKKSLVKTQSKA